MNALSRIREAINRRIIPIIGLIALGAMIWNINQLLPLGWGGILGATWIKITLVIAVFAIWGINEYRLYRQAGIKDEALQGGIAGQQDIEEEFKTLNKQFKTSINNLKQRLSGRNVLIELPWYIFIGPSASGKTKLVKVIDPTAENKAKGVGGTRHCDWFFTPEAVLLDTAGRYTQNEDIAKDKAGWNYFINLVKKYRPLQPINGAVVAISLVEYASLSEQEQDIQAKEIRNRLYELRQQFGMRFPVYLVFTKLDLEAGFRPFFKVLEAKHRNRIWGVTFPYALEEQDSTQNIDIEFSKSIKELELRLHELMFVRLDQEKDIPSRPSICQFPQQMRRLGEVAEHFVSTVFSPVDNTPSLLRGVYFTSSTQEGQPIDSLLGWFSQHFSMDVNPNQPRPVAIERSERNYFVNNLFKEVIFKDKELAGRNCKVERRRSFIYWTGITVALLLVLALAGAWYRINDLNSEYIDKFKTDSKQLRDSALLLAPSDSIAKALPILDQARLVVEDVHQDISPLLKWASFGLNPYHVLWSKADNLYQEVLQYALLPRLIIRLEDYLKNSHPNEFEKIEAQRAYLMLDDPSVYDSQAVMNWFIKDLNALDEHQKNHLKAHLDALLKKFPVRIIDFQSDAGLFQDAQSHLRHGATADDIYRRIKFEIAAKNLPPIKIQEMAGTNAYAVFGNMGQIDSLFTPVGYRDFKQTLEKTLEKNDRDTKIANSKAPNNVIQAMAPSDLKSQVMKVYRKEYTDQWLKALFDLDILAAKDPVELDSILRATADPKTSPLILVLAKAYEQTNFIEFDEELKQNTSSMPLSVFPDPKQTAERFKRLEPVLGNIAGYVNSASAGMSGSASSAGQQAKVAMGELKVIAQQQTAPGLNKWLSSLAKNGDAVLSGNIRKDLNEAWRAEVLDFCKSAINDKYPFARNAREEVQPADFEAFFGTNGIMEKFEAAHLQGQQLSPDVRNQFDRARKIKLIFFSGGRGLNVSFHLTPTDRLDVRIDRSQLDLGNDNRLDYAHGPEIGKALTWPGAGSLSVRLLLTPSSQETRPIELRKEGAWAWFRMLDGASLNPAYNGGYDINFNVDGFTAGYHLVPGSSINPFGSNMKELNGFHCTASLY